ncbi:hypothetical protein AVEN_176526-1 [Araneus ventricosus]|uniref:Uncharacterized protein n=1 Tax=Araneus ventricosus TaxID=182803 RepID=A0A4Y2MAQ5_ARAVE|nr:hypothetical protein AVEN_176526-1 [Araneus ventricosus]
MLAKARQPPGGLRCIPSRCRNNVSLFHGEGLGDEFAGGEVSLRIGWKAGTLKGSAPSLLLPPRVRHRRSGSLGDEAGL